MDGLFLVGLAVVFAAVILGASAYLLTRLIRAIRRGRDGKRPMFTIRSRTDDEPAAA